MKVQIEIRCYAIIIFALSAFILPIGCGTNSGEDNNAGGEDIPSVSGNIGPSGGIVEVTDPSNQLFGAKIEIPPNSISQETTIVVSKAINTPSFPSNPGVENIAIDIGPSGTQFQIPATVTVPYTDESSEQFLGVFVSEKEDEGWTYLPFSVIDKDLDKATIKTSHLSTFMAAPLRKVTPGQTYKFFIDNSTSLSITENSIAKDTIRKVIKDGTLKKLTDCISVTFEETAAMTDADLLIMWEPILPQVDPNGVLRDLPAGFIWISNTQSKIVINDQLSIPLYIEQTENIPAGSLDLYSMITHELSHFLGIPTQHDPNYPDAGVFDDHLAPGDNARQLLPQDEAVWSIMYSSSCGDTHWIGKWLLINFLGEDDQGIWDEDDLSGIGMTAEITNTTWKEADEAGCAVTYSYSVDSNLRYTRRGIDISSQCDFVGINPALLVETGRLAFPSNNTMEDYFDLDPSIPPDEELAAFRWLRQ